MKTDKLPQTGLYRLPSPVSNPDYDRRTRHDWTKAAAIPAGLYFLRRNEDPKTRDSVTIEHIRSNGRGRGFIGYADLKHPVLAQMLPLLKVEEKPNVVAIALMNSLEHNPFEILQELIDDGVISVKQLEAACQKINDRYDEEEQQSP